MQAQLGLRRIDSRLLLPLQLDFGSLAFVDPSRMREQLRDSGAAARERYARLMRRMNTPHRILARDKAAFVLGTLGLTCASVRMRSRCMHGCRRNAWGRCMAGRCA